MKDQTKSNCQKQLIFAALATVVPVGKSTIDEDNTVSADRPN